MMKSDKIKHVLLMIAIVVGTGVVLDGYIGLIGVVIGVIVGLMISVVKEMFDVYVQKDNTSDEAIWDLIADFVGICVGVIVCVACLILR